MNYFDKAPIYRLPWRLLLRKSHLLLSERGRSPVSIKGNKMRGGKRVPRIE
jgi:hypothetical protein